MTITSAEPIFAVGQMVDYIDRHGRPQSGRVMAIRATWNGSPWPYIIYQVKHPTYAGGRCYIRESDTVEVSGS